MSARDWVRALQVPVLPVSGAPVIVGSLAGAAVSGRALDVPVLILVLGSVLFIQAAANLQKGIVESRDLGTEPARPESAFVFDAGAVRRLGLRERSLRRLTVAFFATGAAWGLLVVAIRADLVLLLLGMGGFVAAYSYSGPPFKFSYRGLGEISTFFAFGPLMFAGAFYAQHPYLDLRLLPWGAIFGFLAAAISYARYFPPAAEDATKGKRTPVLRLGKRFAIVPYLLLLGGAASIMIGTALYYGQALVSSWFGVQFLSGLLTLAIGAIAARDLRSADVRRVERGVRSTVLLHFAVSLLLGWISFEAVF